jgi:hypothetical protein
MLVSSVLGGPDWASAAGRESVEYDSQIMENPQVEMIELPRSPLSSSGL